MTPKLKAVKCPEGMKLLHTLRGHKGIIYGLSWSPDVKYRKIFAGAVFKTAPAKMHKLIEAFGYRYRGEKGSHCVFKHESISKIMNLQEEKGIAKV
ncbi:MAG: hypothetical protein ACUZ8O_07050 [Candidatus Anammoxibacter sp.]